MKIELVNSYFLPKDCPKMFYSVEHVQSGHINSLWSTLVEAVKARDSCGMGYHVVAKYRHEQKTSKRIEDCYEPSKFRIRNGDN